MTVAYDIERVAVAAEDLRRAIDAAAEHVVPDLVAFDMGFAYAAAGMLTNTIKTSFDTETTPKTTRRQNEKGN